MVVASSQRDRYCNSVCGTLVQLFFVVIWYFSRYYGTFRGTMVLLVHYIYTVFCHTFEMISWHMARYLYVNEISSRM